MRVYLDSNVILSGLISHSGPPRIILDLCSLKLPGVVMMTGRYNLEEIERNLNQRFVRLVPVYEDFMSRLQLEILPLPPIQKVLAVGAKMSAKDAPVLVAAQMASADYLVTGDKKGFPADRLKPVRLASPATFVNEILPRFIKSSIG